MEVEGFELLSKRLAQSNHVRVSVAHVVLMVLQSSAPFARAMFAKDGAEGLLVLVIAILPEGYWSYAGTISLVTVPVLREVGLHFLCLSLHLDTESI